MQTLREGDIILILGGKPITRASDLQYIHKQEQLSAHIFRQGEELTLNIPILPATDLDITYLINLCGAWVHKPHLAARQRFHLCHSEVYVCAYMYASPVDLYELRLTAFIYVVQGKEFDTIENFRDQCARFPITHTLI